MQADMSLMVFYPQIKLVHIACVILSGSLFFIRGSLLLSGFRIGDHTVLRYLSYAIDTTLLTAALMLVTLLQQYPFVNAWLTVKVLLLVLYIALGVFALRRGKSRAVRARCFVAALFVYGYIVSVAYFHDPYGALLLLINRW